MTNKTLAIFKTVLTITSLFMVYCTYKLALKFIELDTNAAALLFTIFVFMTLILIGSTLNCLKNEK